MNRPLVLLTASYITGIAAAGFFDVKAGASLALGGAVLLAALAAWFLKRPGNGRLFLAVFFVLGLALSGLAMEESRTPLEEYAGHRVALVGQVADEPDVREDRVYYLLEAKEVAFAGERRALSGKVRLRVREPGRIYGYGDLIRASGLLVRAEGPGNPGDFDYKQYLERQGIRLIMSVPGDRALTLLDGGRPPNPVLAAALAVKAKLYEGAAAGLSPAQAAVVNGILFGVQGKIDRSTRELYSETGIVHILSVSGLHVGLLLGGLAGLFRLLRVPPGLTAPLATPALLFYALLTGLVPPVLRATLMALLFLWAHHLGRDRDWPNALALAALLILLWRPLQFYNPGFQLSFAATWGLLYLGPVLAGLLKKMLRKMPASGARPLALGLAIPLAAQLATLPLTVWYYSMLSPVSIPANLLAVPLVGLIMLLGLLAAGLGLLWLPLAELVNVSNGFLLDFFALLVEWLHRLPGAVWYVSRPLWPAVAVWYALLVSGAALAGGWRPAKQAAAGWGIAAVLAAVAAVLVFFPFPGAGEQLAVHFIDVGQGDCALVRAGGRNVLIDAGGRPDEFKTGSGAGDQVVVPYLRRIGVNRLDALFLTHPHEDHAGGARAVLRELAVGLVVVSPAGGADDYAATGEQAKAADSGLRPAGGGEAKEGGTPFGSWRSTPAESAEGYASVLAVAAARGIPVQEAHSGDLMELGGVALIDVLYPAAGTSGPKKDLNDSSLVLKVSGGGHSVLLTADAGPAAQDDLLRGGADLASGVLKAPHHGSRALLPEFVERVGPESAVISVGSRNNFGHPAQSTVDLLVKAGARVYRTDRDGAVIIKISGRRMEVETGGRK